VAAPHDLKLELQEAGEEIHGFFEYRLDLFKPLTIARLIERYRKLVNLAVSTPDARLEELLHEVGKADRERRQEVQKDLKKAGLAMLQRRRQS
jgi:non-ribosomal peptide synthetase component F